MTSRSYLQMLLRRWYILALVGIITVVAMAAVMRHDVGVYWTRVTVVFVPPVTSEVIGNVLEGSDPSLVYFAAAVEQRVNGASTQPRVSSTAATLYGTGVRQGYSVGLLNSGGQWQTNFNRPMLSVEVVDRSPEMVQSTLDDVLQRIDDAARSMQIEGGARTTDMITTDVAPAQATITYIGGNAKRAAVGLGLLGLGIGLSLAFTVDGVIARRRPAPRRALASAAVRAGTA